MAYHNTGYARRTTLTVTKGDYRQSYNICDPFTAPNGNTFAAITNRDFARLTPAEYNTRLNAFCQYVYAREQGLEDDCPDLTQGAIEYDPTTCPIDAAPAE